jgi:hypothetical protein
LGGRKDAIGSKSQGPGLQCAVNGKPGLYDAQGENNYLYCGLEETKGAGLDFGGSEGNTPRDHYAQTPTGPSGNGKNEINFNVNVNVNFSQFGTQGDPGVAENSFIHFNKGSGGTPGGDGYDPRWDDVKTAKGPFVAGALKKFPTAGRGNPRAGKGHKGSADGKKP